MRDNPLWINVTKLMKSSVGAFIGNLLHKPELQPYMQTYLDRLNAIENIKKRAFHIETITGEQMGLDHIVDIFNEVNSGGTKLSKGDLALARICAAWPEARAEMKQRLGKWEKVGFWFKVDWLLRCINAVVTGESLFTALQDVEVEEFERGLYDTEKHIDYLLDLIASRLGLDHDRVLGSRYSFPLMARYLAERGGKLHSPQERDRLLYWYIHTLLWGRYSGSTESVLATDLNVIKSHENALDRLIDLLAANRGDLRVYPRDFEGSTRGNRFYPLLYMLTRVWRARDWQSGLELKAHLLGNLSSLQVHHIFPQALLYEYGYERQEVNAIANFTFLTQDTNLLISKREPAEYLMEFAQNDPEAVASHWIPMDRELWRVENYREFLAARRELLSRAANDFLDSLYHGAVPDTEPIADLSQVHEISRIPGGIESEEEETLLLECMIWLESKGLPSGDFEYELIDEATGQVLAILDLAWPEGLQEGKSEPAALLLDESAETLRIAQQNGYRCFIDIVDFKHYVEEHILALEAEA